MEGMSIEVNGRKHLEKRLGWRDLFLLRNGTSLVQGWFDELVKLKLGRSNLLRLTDGELDRSWLAIELGMDERFAFNREPKRDLTFMFHDNI